MAVSPFLSLMLDVQSARACPKPQRGDAQGISARLKQTLDDESPLFRVLDLHGQMQRGGTFYAVDRVDVALVVREDVLEHVGATQRGAIGAVSPPYPPQDQEEYIRTRSVRLSRACLHQAVCMAAPLQTRRTGVP